MAERLQKKSQSESWRHPAFSRILLSGKAFVADVSGAMYWPAEETLIVSDLHFLRDEDVSPLDAQLPSDDVGATLSRLADVVSYYQPSQVIVIGDSLPSTSYDDGLEARDLEKLHAIQDTTQWIWVGSGVSDDVKAKFGGTYEDEVTVSGMTFRRKPVMAPVWHEVAGCMHPVARISRQGRKVSSRCFISTGTRLVMPAFGGHRGGNNVLAPSFAPIFGNETVFVWMAGWSEVSPVAARQLLEDD